MKHTASKKKADNSTVSKAPSAQETEKINLILFCNGQNLFQMIYSKRKEYKIFFISFDFCIRTLIGHSTKFDQQRKVNLFY